MKKENYSTPLDLKNIRITDAFWEREQELVRREVIPYQWDALNDAVPGAAPSYCMRNFKVAGRMMKEKREQGNAFTAPSYTFRGFQALPEDPRNPDPDRFYGFVFQDSDFAKWIEAVGYSLMNHPDPELERVADGAIDMVCAAQAENGYLDTYYIINGMDRIFTNLRDHHELYCFGHLAEGAISYYQATGKDKLLKAAERYADFICSQFGPEEGKRKGYPGHEIAEMALTRLYEMTGEGRYLELARFFLDMRGTRPYYFDLEEKERAEHEGRPYKEPGGEPRFQYHQAHMPVRQQSEAVGHAVRAVYLYSGMADAARLTGDEEMFAACERLWDSITKEKLYITGGIGGTHVGEAFSYPYDLPNDTAYSETCAAIGLAFFARRMLQVQAESRYGDVMEQALYNTVLAGMALDGRSFFYVNPLEVYPEGCRQDERKRHVQPVRQKWFGCACCPPNIARVVSSLGAYIYTRNEDTLYTHLYVGSHISTSLNGRELEMALESSFPWEGEVRAVIRIPDRGGAIGDAAGEAVPSGEAAKKSSCFGRLAFRIPGWCRTAEAEVLRSRKTETDEPAYETLVSSHMARHGRDIQIVSAGVRTEEISDISPNQEQQTLSASAACMELCMEKGYLYLSGDWQDGDEIRLDFPMEIRCVSANTKVREDIGRVAFARGPLCYCMEEADNGKELWLLRVDKEKLWQADKAARMAEAVPAGDDRMEAGGAVPAGDDRMEAGEAVPAGSDRAQGYARTEEAVQSGGSVQAEDSVRTDERDTLQLNNETDAADSPQAKGSLKGAAVETSTELGHEMRVLKIPGLRQEASGSGEELYGEFRPARERETTLTFVPYYAWNNRGEGEMSVWVRL